jgi:DNA-directed RNA polymerase specialized sigma subunit
MDLTKDTFFACLWKILGTTEYQSKVSILTTKFYDFVSEAQKTRRFNEEVAWEMISEQFEDAEIIQSVWSLVAMFSMYSLAFKMCHKRSQVNEASLNGSLGYLANAARCYQPEKGKLSTFATYAIRNGLANDACNEKSIVFPFHERALAYKVAALMELMPDITPEEIAAILNKPLSKIETHFRAIRSQGVFSLDEPIGEDGGVLGDVIADTQDVAEEVANADLNSTIYKKFLPAVADIFGEDAAYLALLRTGMLNNFKPQSFYIIEKQFCRYLTVTKMLNELAETFPQYKSTCEALKHIYATQGEDAFKIAIRKLSDEYIFIQLFNNAKKEANKLIEAKKPCECFKPAATLNYMWGKMFPAKLKAKSLQDEERSKAWQLRQRLREIGLNQLAYALAVAANS